MAELIGEGHEEIAPDPGLEILFRRVRRKPLKRLREGIR